MPHLPAAEVVWLVGIPWDMYDNARRKLLCNCFAEAGYKYYREYYTGDKSQSAQGVGCW